MENQVNFEEEGAFLDNDEYLLASAIGPNCLEPLVPESWEAGEEEEEKAKEDAEDTEGLWNGLETEAEYLEGLARGPSYCEPAPPEDWERECQGKGVGVISTWTPADIAKYRKR